MNNYITNKSILTYINSILIVYINSILTLVPLQHHVSLQLSPNLLCRMYQSF